MEDGKILEVLQRHYDILNRAWEQDRSGYNLGAKREIEEVIQQLGCQIINGKVYIPKEI